MMAKTMTTTKREASLSVRFECSCSWTKMGQQICVVGSSSELGNWNPSNSVPLDTSKDEFPLWSSPNTVDFCASNSHDDTTIEFKFIIRGGHRDAGPVTWENLADNRRLPLVLSPNAQLGNAVYKCSFGLPEFKWSLQESSPPIVSTTSFERCSRLSRQSSQTQELKFCASWMGKEMRLARSNSKLWEGRTGSWCSGNLSGSALAIVEGDKTAGSWRNKLDLAKRILSNSASSDSGGVITEDRDDVVKTLVDVSMYLGLIKSGMILCVEDGAHHRPNYHAGVAKDLFLILESLQNDVYRQDDKQGDEVRVTTRKLYPSLPSFSSEFTTGQPLTRIRDIAHRNDIPQNLKQEIKHTIQNKLHRCAGPEDLVATEAMLKRFTDRPQDYPAPFIEEFRKFHKELRQFFNATDLAERLSFLAAAASQDEGRLLLDEQRTKELIGRYLDSRDYSDRPAPSLTALLVTVSGATNLRSLLVKHLQEAAHLETKQQHMALMQQMRLSEIGLEDVVFVSLSRVVSLCEADEKRWVDLLEAIICGVKNVQMSGVRRDECLALVKELGHHQTRGLNSKDELLFLKATVDRVRRLCEVYSELMLSLYPPRATQLGRALGVPPHSVQMFAEADIRANVVFQISRLCSLLLKRIRRLLGEQGLDAIVAGRVVGKLVAVDSLEGLSQAQFQKPDDAGGLGPFVLLVKSATGDEEVAGLVASLNVVGIILSHDLPHLSHLGVRARQENVVFVASESYDAVRDIYRLAGQHVSLNAESREVSVEPCSEADVMAWIVTQNKPILESGGSLGDLGSVCKEFSEAPVDTSCACRLLTDSHMPQSLCGAKAHACAELRCLADVSLRHSEHALQKLYDQLSEELEIGGEQRNVTDFSAPRSISIPFGTLEAVVKDQGRLDEFDNLRRILNSIQDINAEASVMEEKCSAMQDLIRSSAVSSPACLLDLQHAVCREIGSDKRIMVRSSASVEDLLGMSAAGLYDSVLNVNPYSVDSFCRAVGDVWASLYTRRAVASRRLSLADEFETSMAILIQEIVYPTHSFVIHTINPLTRDRDEIYVEMASGLGETLASGSVRGSPFRFTVNRRSGDMNMLSFASYSNALLPRLLRKSSFTQLGAARSNGALDERSASPVRQAVLDYSLDPVAINPTYRAQLGVRLAAVGAFIEEQFKRPQDIEGCVSNEDIVIVQSRPQPLM